MKKTNMYLALAAYILRLDNSGAEPLTKEERKKIREAMKAALLMLNSIPEPIGTLELDNALANLLAYIVSNGKSTFAEKVNHLSNIVIKTRACLEIPDKTPIAEVLDMVYDKKTHPFMRVFRTIKK